MGQLKKTSATRLKAYFPLIFPFSSFLFFFPLQWVPSLHILHRDRVPTGRLLLAQPAGRGLHHPHTQAVFFQLHQWAGGVGRPAGEDASHPHPHPSFPDISHDRPGGLVQQKEWYPGLGVFEEHGRGGRGMSGGCGIFQSDSFLERLSTFSCSTGLFCTEFSVSWHLTGKFWDT